MARKKSSAVAAARAQKSDNLDLKPQSKSPVDFSPDHRMNNLKTLNQLLLKEAMEKRFQIDQLKVQIEDLNESQPLASDLEREVCHIVLASAMAEEVRKVIFLQETLGFLAKEKDDMMKELGGVVSERDLVKKEAALKKDEILGLEDVVRGLLECKQRLEGEIRASKDQFGLLKGEEEVLRSKVVELEGENGEAREEIRGLRASIVALGKEKEDMERECDSKVRELEFELGELSKKMGEMLREKDEVEEMRARHEVEILDLKNEVDKLRSNAVKLEAMCGDYCVKNAGLLDENDAVKREFAALEKELVEKAVKNAEKKKPGLLKWLYPATTVVLAAIAYAACSSATLCSVFYPVGTNRKT